MKKPWGTCREVTALISAREDRNLSRSEGLVLRVHAFICTRCERWEQQVKFMRQSMQAWKNYRD
jgi:Putative zinc-finger